MRNCITVTVQLIDLCRPKNGFILDFCPTLFPDTDLLNSEMPQRKYCLAKYMELPNSMKIISSRV